MKERAYQILNRIFGLGLTIAFFAGGLPLFPFLYALIVGGETGESIANFLYKSYYPWVFILASVSVLAGLAAMYVGGRTAFSVKDLSGGKKEPPMK